MGKEKEEIYEEAPDHDGHQHVDGKQDDLAEDDDA